MTDRIYKFDSNKSINIKFIWDFEEANKILISSDQNNNSSSNSNGSHENNNQHPRLSSFNPEFSHQMFKEEQILGYDPLRLNVLFTAGSLHCHIDTNYTIKSKNITNVERELNKFLSKTDPPIQSIDNFKNYVEEKEKRFKPVGQKLNEYTIVDNETGEEMVYEVYFGRISDKSVLRYHERLQIFALWFIDGSSFIHSEDSNWDVIFLFERRIIDGEPRYGIAGYCTIYNFYHHPSQTRPRISQFLILPPYQRMGHGRNLLNSIYNYYKSNDSVYGPVYDLTVEDPGEQFSLLRNTVDLSNIMNMKLFSEIDPSTNSMSYSSNSQLFDTIRKQLLICPIQSKICLEIYLLSKLMNLPPQNPTYKSYRITIKKKLFKQYVGSEVEESIKNDPVKLKECEDNKKKILLELYKATELEYNQTIQSLGLVG